MRLDKVDEVAVFGGIFLLLVALNFLMDEAKELHWLGHIELGWMPGGSPAGVVQ